MSDDKDKDKDKDKKVDEYTQREYCLKQAHEAVMHGRNHVYGDPTDNFKDTAKLFNIFIQAKLRKFDINIHPYVDIIEAQDIALLMIFLKTARLINTPAHVDSYIDIAGYAACGLECAMKRAFAS